ncbi:sulfate/molybdate ABC transporter ATP-binding protein [Allokutzneria albata]|uniref:Molybdate transport system ATP-binding protein n=1 Tax=Allokutzneria albata TaxID=211114 RepID=A0A1H0AX20_ALLAB|nr:molybdate transport system ATP-binding protein [Allokutzneria albata]
MRARFRLARGAFDFDVELSVEPGEVVAVLGPNGSGKSTLLNLIAGLVRPDSGSLELGGRDLLGVPPHQRGIGLLAQEPLLFPHLTVLANVEFGPRAQRRADHRDVALRWLEEVDAAEFADRRPRQLSGGQAQRVALARALAADPELMLLDEPLTALDVDAAPAVRGLLRRVLRTRNRPAIMVTHDALDALVLADRVVVLDAGRIVEQGPTRAVLKRPRSAFAARIAGLNLVSGTTVDGGLRSSAGVFIAGRGTAGAGEDGVAVFAPAAVAVHRDNPHGSPRNALRVRLAGMEPHGDLIRLRAEDGLAADITPAAAAELELEPGQEVWFVVKATEVGVHAARGGV